MDELIPYMDYQWVQIEDGILTIGLREESFEDFDDIHGLNLPEENSELSPEEVCGEIQTDQGPVNIYCPVDGVVVEVNQAALDDPALIIDDCTGDGWLLKVEAQDINQLDPKTWSDSEDDEELEDEEL